MIEMGKKYRTREGNKVTVLATNLKSEWPVVAVIHYENDRDAVFGFRKDGKVVIGADRADDLIEIRPYEDFKIDDKVLVWMDGKPKLHRHFAGLSGFDKPMTWEGGGTSWTSGLKEVWEHCEKADET